MFGLKSFLTAALVTASIGLAGTASAHEGYDAQGNYVGSGYSQPSGYTPGYAPAPQYAPQYAPVRAPDCAPAPVYVPAPPPVYCPPRPVIAYPAYGYGYRPYCPPAYPRYYGGHDRFRLNIRW